jgi:hypothetical protein
MATTAVFAEIIVIGLQVQAWLALYVAALSDAPWMPGGLEQWVALVTIVVVAAAYMLGVVMDRVADGIFRRACKRFPAPVKRFGEEILEPSTSDDVTFRERRLAVLHASGGLGTFIEYQRSRLRVARATFVNALISLPAIVLAAVLEPGESPELLMLLALAVPLLIVGSAFSALRINAAYEGSLLGAHGIVTPQPRQEP